MVTRVKENSMTMSKNFPPDSQNSASPYAFTATQFNKLNHPSVTDTGKGGPTGTIIGGAHPKRTMHATHTAAVGISSRQKDSTVFKAVISNGISRAS